MNKIRLNLHGALGILKDFESFNDEIQIIKSDLEKFENLESVNLLVTYKKMKTMMRVKNSLEARNMQPEKREMLREKYRVLDEAYENFERIVLNVLVKDMPKNMGQSCP